MIQADKDDVELLGYLKLDILGVRMLSSMRHALDEIARTTGEKVDLDRIPLDDPETFELIRASDTIGCFQIESPGQRELLQKLQPERWEDLIVDISLFRPGPVKSDMITPYLRRRAGLEPPVYVHPGLRPALKETFGVIVYHEQVMRTLAAMAGYTLTQADHIRRNLNDDQMLPSLRKDFLRRAVGRGVDSATAERTWDAVAQFASFGFCKAHAAAFAVPTYQSSWLKANYPAHLIAGLLTHDPGMYPRRLILEDARHHDIPILPLDVNRSEREYVVEEVRPRAEGGRVSPERRRGGPKGRPSSSGDGPTDISDPAASPTTFGIRLALQDVHGITDAEIRSILVARSDRPFTDVGDFLRRTTVSRPVTEALAHAGAFDSLAPSRRAHVYAAMTTDAPREGDQLTLTDAAAPEHRFKDYSDAEVVRAELEVLGLDASRHIVSFFEPLLNDLGVVRTNDLRRHRGGEHVMVAGVKVASQTPAIRSGQRIIFLTLDDATGPVEITVFESVQPKVARTVFHSYAMAVWGELRRTGVGGVGIIAEEIWDLTVLHRARARGELREAMTDGSGVRARTPAPRVEPRTVARTLWHASGGSAG
jgi:error-prone DNA polymerase